MLIRVDVLSENPFSLNIRDAKPTDSIIVEKIDGLDPPDVDNFVGDYARDGGYYNGRRVPRRQVIINLLLNPNYSLGESVSGLRSKLHRAFAQPFFDNDSVTLLLKDDTLPDRFLVASMDKFEGNPFSEGPSEPIVTLTAPNPFLLDYASTVVTATGPSVPLTYNGTADTGFEINATVTVTTPTIKFDLNGTVMVLTAPFLSGDLLYIDTRPGSRKIQITRVVGGATVVYDALYAKVQGSPWLRFHSLNNVLQAYGSSSTSVVANITQVRHRAMYWGI